MVSKETDSTHGLSPFPSRSILLEQEAEVGFRRSALGAEKRQYTYRWEGL